MFFWEFNYFIALYMKESWNFCSFGDKKKDLKLELQIGNFCVSYSWCQYMLVKNFAFSSAYSKHLRGKLIKCFRLKPGFPFWVLKQNVEKSLLDVISTNFESFTKSTFFMALSEPWKKTASVISKANAISSKKKNTQNLGIFLIQMKFMLIDQLIIQIL